MKLKIIFFFTCLTCSTSFCYGYSNTLSTPNSQIFIGKDADNSSEIIRVKPPLQNATPSVTMPPIEIKPQIVVPTPWNNNNLTKE